MFTKNTSLKNNHALPQRPCEALCRIFNESSLVCLDNYCIMNETLIEKEAFI
jgi:hypothetical protein